jgi:uncharacterized membrane protein
MLMKFLGICLLAAGGLAALIMLGGLIGFALGLIWLVIKFAVPLLLIYAGYRLLVRDKHRIAY